MVGLDTLQRTAFRRHPKQIKAEGSHICTLYQGLKTFVLYATSKAIRASRCGTESTESTPRSTPTRLFGAIRFLVRREMVLCRYFTWKSYCKQQHVTRNVYLSLFSTFSAVTLWGNITAGMTTHFLPKAALTMVCEVNVVAWKSFADQLGRCLLQCGVDWLSWRRLLLDCKARMQNRSAWLEWS